MSKRSNRSCTRRNSRSLRFERLSARRLLAADCFHNPVMAEDVDDDQAVTLQDAFLVINHLTVPINMRTVGDRRMPAANIVSMVFLDRRAQDCLDPSQLMRGITEELQLIKRDELGLSFVLALDLTSRIPRVLAKQTGKHRCWASLVLTNVGPTLANCNLPRRDDGRIAVAGLVLDDVEVLPVFRPFQCANFAASGYAGRLSLGMHYDARVISRTTAREILGEYAGRLRQSMKDPGARSAAA